MSDEEYPATSWANWAWKAYREGRLVSAPNPAAPTFAEGNSQQGCFTAADLEAAFRVGLALVQDEVQKLRIEAGRQANGVRFQALDDVRHLIRNHALTAPADLAARVTEARK